MGRGLVGLLEYSRRDGRSRGARFRAAGLATTTSTNYPAYEPYMYECYSNALEGLVLLARLTGDSRYRQTARQMAETSMVFGGVWQSTTLGPNGRRSPCGGQVHCQLTTARGLLDLHELTASQVTSLPSSGSTTTSAATRSRSPAASGSTSTAPRRTKPAPTPTGCVSTSSSGG